MRFRTALSAGRKLTTAAPALDLPAGIALQRAAAGSGGERSSGGASGDDALAAAASGELMLVRVTDGQSVQSKLAELLRHPGEQEGPRRYKHTSTGA